MASKGRIKSDITLLKIIKELREREGAGVTELADALGVAKSTVHGHLTVLEEHGYAVKRDGKYHIGLRFLDLGIFAREQQGFFQYAKPVVDEIAEETGEKVWCITEQHGKAIYLYTASGSHSVKTWANTGEAMDLHCLASGKAILAYLPAERRDEILDDVKLRQQTDQTIADRQELMEELEEVRERGVAFNLEESVRDLHAIGAPIRGSDGTVYGAISMSGPANRLTEEKLEAEFVDLLLGYTNEIEINLRYS